MPTYKVVLFSDSIHQQYMIEQEQAIKKATPQVETELAESTDSRLALFSNTPQRMPCIMIFKDGARMQTKHAKRSHSEIVNWVLSRVS